MWFRQYSGAILLWQAGRRYTEGMPDLICYEPSVYDSAAWHVLDAFAIEYQRS